jgi:hypothetical protein
MSSEYFLEAAGGLQSFNIAGEWYVFLSALAKVVDKSNGNISVLLGRHSSLSDGAPPVLLASRTKMQAVWPRLLQTYEVVTAKISAGGEYKRKKVRPPNNLTLYPLEVAVRIVRHYRDDVDAAVITGVEDLWDQVRSEKALPAEEDSAPEPVQIRTEENRQHELIEGIPGRMKREPASYLQFPTIMRGHRIIIDLTRVGESEADDVQDNLDTLQAQLMTTPWPRTLQQMWILP